MSVMETYLQETPMLDFSHPAIQKLISGRNWKNLPEFDRILAIYNYVRDEILFGYNTDDGLPASQVLADGYGQCNTKATLFMALLRCCGVPCRSHGFTIDKRLQKGAMTGLVYALAPRDVFHSCAEVYLDGVWYCLEGLILDRAYLMSLQRIHANHVGPFSGYGVAARDLQNPVIDFDRNDTFIQSEGICQDFGVYGSPDDLLRDHGQDISPLKAFVYRHIGRRLMNRNVQKIREQYR